MQRRIDKQRLERAAEEARKLIEIERQERQAKTAKLRELRLQKEANASKTGVPRPRPRRVSSTKKRSVRRVIDVE